MVLALATPALAKHVPVPVVQPLIHNGIRYSAPNTDPRVGYLEAWCISSNTLLWRARVFQVWANPLEEEDTQWVYITELQLDSGKIVVTDEKRRQFLIDCQSGKVESSTRLWLLLVVLLGIAFAVGTLLLILSRKKGRWKG